MFFVAPGKRLLLSWVRLFLFIFLGRGDTSKGCFERGIMNDPYKTRQTLIQRVKESPDERSWEEFFRVFRIGLSDSAFSFERDGSMSR